MNRSAVSAAFLFLIVSTPIAARAQAPAPISVPLVGTEIRDDKGKPVGRVERLINGPDGRPVQALVRVDRILRTLPLEALAPGKDGYTSVLSRAEIAALPPSD
jgi:hypothetical protein